MVICCSTKKREINLNRTQKLLFIFERYIYDPVARCRLSETISSARVQGPEDEAEALRNLENFARDYDVVMIFDVAMKLG